MVLAQSGRTVQEIVLAPAMRIHQKPLLSGNFPQVGRSRHNFRSFMDADDLLLCSPPWDSASSQHNLSHAEVVETFWMLEVVQGCMGYDAHVVTAMLSVCPSPGLLVFAGCWLVAMEERDDHPGE